MIPDPQNVFEELQNDVATKLMQTAPFSTLRGPTGGDFQVFTEDEGDIQFEFDLMIGQLGLAIVVHSPSGKIMNPDLGGPLFDLSFDVWVSEAPTFNRSVMGTQVRGMRAALIVMGTLHGFVPTTAQILVPIQQNGFDIERERSYIEKDQPGTLIVSRKCHFQVPLVGGEITTE